MAQPIAWPATLRTDAKAGASRRRRPVLALCVALLGLPIFVMMGTSGVSMPTGASIEERGSLISVPMSVLLVGLLILGTRGYAPRSRRVSLATGCLAIFVFVNLLSFGVGVATAGFSLLSLAFLVQTFLPMLGFVAGRRIGQFDPVWLARNLRRMSVITLVAFGGVALTTLATGGQPWIYVGEAIGPLSIPQARRFLPTVVAFALILFIRGRFGGRVKLFHLAVAVVMIVLLAAGHSRTALVILALGYIMFITVDARARLQSRLLLVLAGGLAAVILWAVWGMVDLQNAPMALSRLSSSDEAAETSTDLREAGLAESLSETFSMPLGRMYLATETQSLGGVASEYARVSNSENQLGEYGLRAGPVALAAAVIAIGSILLRSRKKAILADGKATPEVAGLWLACCATIVGSVFTQLSLTQPYTGNMLWFGMGVLYALSDRTRAN